MPPPPRSRRARLAAALLASAVAGLVPACAGAGKRYACNPDAGVCGGNPYSDAGPGSVSDFISTPVVVWHDGKHNSDADLVAYNGALYSAFRHADSYAVSADGGVVVVTSTDQGASWQETSTLALDGMDSCASPSWPRTSRNCT